MTFFQKIYHHPALSKGLIFFDQAIVSGSNFLVGILLVRFLGLENYGIFALLWMGILFALGVNQSFVTKPLLSIAPKMESEQQNQYISDLHWVQILVGVVFLIISFITYFFADFFFEKNISQLILPLGGIIFCQLLHDFYRKIGFVKNQIFQVLWIDIILYGGQIIFIIGLIWVGKINLWSLMMALLIVHICSILWSWINFKKEKISIKNLQQITSRHFHFSKWLLGTSILQWLSGNYFIIVGASILGALAVGAIRMVQNIMGLCHILFLAMENLLPIEAARQYHLDGEYALTHYLRKMTIQLGLGFCIILLLISLLSPQILHALYGAAAVEHSYIVFSYCLLYVLVFLGHPLRFYLRTIEKTFPIFLAYVLGAIFSVLTANFLLNYFQMNGLLLGLLFTQAITVITYFIFIKNQKTVSTLEI